MVFSVAICRVRLDSLSSLSYPENKLNGGGVISIWKVTLRFIDINDLKSKLHCVFFIRLTSLMSEPMVNLRLPTQIVHGSPREKFGRYIRPYRRPHQIQTVKTKRRVVPGMIVAAIVHLRAAIQDRPGSDYYHLLCKRNMNYETTWPKLFNMAHEDFRRNKT